MPKYHFYVSDGSHTLNVDSVNLSNAAVARAEGLMLVGQMINDAGMRYSPVDKQCVEVMDESGRTLFLMNFTLLTTATELSTG